MTTNIELKGHESAILQSSNSQGLSYASIYALKHKEYYDFVLNLDVMVRDSKTFGVVFRMKNPYNYYALEISQKDGYKRLVRVINGNYNILSEIRDGGIFQFQWFLIQILTVKDEITVKMGDSNQNASYDNLSIVFKENDQTHRKGTIGVFVNGNSGFLFDNLSVEPKICWTPYEPNPEISFTSDRANVYDEDYNGDPQKKFFVSDPSSRINGPSEWAYQLDVLERDNVIIQRSEIADKSFLKLPTMFILKDKIIKRGWFSLDLAGYQNGAIGVVFKYKDQNNYYLFELGGTKKSDRYFQMRKNVNGMMKLIKRVNTNEELDFQESQKSKHIGYTPFKWYYLRVVLDGPNITIFYKKVGKPEKIVIKVTDDDLPYGMIGFTSFKTKAVFDNFMIRPRVEDIRSSFDPRDIPSNVNPDQDIYLYNIDKKGKIQLKQNKKKMKKKMNKQRSCPILIQDFQQGQRNPSHEFHP